MRTRVLFIGAAGGLLASAALYYPLYVCLPGQYVAGWPAANAGLGWALAGLAGLILLGTGALAGRQSGLRGRTGAAFAGGVAGLIGMLVVYLLLGAPAAGAQGAHALLQYGARPAENEAGMLILLAEGVVGVHWWTFLAAWIACLMGAFLGGLGGALAGPGTPSTDGGFDGQLGVIAVSGLLSGVLVTIVAVVVLSQLGPSVQKAADQAGHPLTYPSNSLLAWALFTNLANLLAWQAVGWWWLRRGLADAPSRVMNGYVAGGLPILGLLFILLIEPGVGRQAIFIAGGLVSLVLAGVTLRQAWGLRQAAKAPVQWPSVQQLLPVGLLTGLIMVGTAFIGLSSAALNDVLLIIQNINVLALYDPSATPPAEIMPMITVVQTNYATHQTAAGIGLAAILASGLLVSGGAALVNRLRPRV